MVLDLVAAVFDAVSDRYRLYQGEWDWIYVNIWSTAVALMIRSRHLALDTQFEDSFLLKLI